MDMQNWINQLAPSGQNILDSFNSGAELVNQGRQVYDTCAQHYQPVMQQMQNGFNTAAQQLPQAFNNAGQQCPCCGKPWAAPAQQQPEQSGSSGGILGAITPILETVLSLI